MKNVVDTAGDPFALFRRPGAFLGARAFFDLGTLLTLVAGADAKATAENGPLADSSSETVVNNSPSV